MSVTRFPVAPLLARVDSADDLARLVGVSKRSVYRRCHAGLDQWTADRWALALGVTPWEVWGDWGSPWCPPVEVAVPARNVVGDSWADWHNRGTGSATEEPEAVTRGQWSPPSGPTPVRVHADAHRFSTYLPSVGAMRLA